jgi:hypothetical protein
MNQCFCQISLRISIRVVVVKFFFHPKWLGAMLCAMLSAAHIGAVPLAAAPPLPTGFIRLDSAGHKTMAATARSIGSPSDFSSPPLVVQPLRPFSYGLVRARCWTLINGDRLSGELLRELDAGWEVGLSAGSRVRIPRRALASIAMPPGERELLGVNFASPEFATQWPVKLVLPKTQADFRLSLRRRSSQAFGVEWTFADGSQLRIDSDAQGHWRIRASDGSIQLDSRSGAEEIGGRDLRLRRIGQRLFLSLDDRLIAAGPMPDGELARMEIHGVEGETLEPQSLVDLLVFVEVRPDRTTAPQPARDLDQIVGATAETWWARAESVGPHGVAWSAPLPGGESLWRRSWPEILGVWFRTPANPIPAAPLFGCVAEIELEPSTDRPDLPGNRLTAVLMGSESGRLLLGHPLLGVVAVPHAAVRRVSRRFTGEWRLLDARESRFDAKPLTVSDSAHPMLEGEFYWRELSSRTVTFSVEAHGLEPSGPATPPGSRTLSQLRAGKLTTELFVNNQRVGALNDLISDWSLPGQFDRIRVRIPHDLLRLGENTWRIRQQRGTSRQMPFDDCRLRNAALEIEQPILSTRK